MQENNERRNPFLLAPVVTLAVLVVFGILSFIPFEKSLVAYIVGIGSALIVFSGLIFAAFRLRGRKWWDSCTQSRAKGGLPICLFAAGIMMVQSAMIRSFLIGDVYNYRTYSFYGISLDVYTDSIGLFILIFVLLAVLPAVWEGILFRGFLMHEYRYGGVLVSALVSSLLYAMIGVSFAEFPIHFLNGVLLCAVVFLTGNVAFSILAHSLYGLFVLSFEKYFMFIAAETPSLSFLILATIGLFCVICFCGSAEKILRTRGESEDRMPIRCKRGKLPIVLWDIFAAPMIWADVCFFMLIGILHIFLDV